MASAGIRYSQAVASKMPSLCDYHKISFYYAESYVDFKILVTDLFKHLVLRDNDHEVVAPPPFRQIGAPFSTARRPSCIAQNLPNRKVSLPSVPLGSLAADHTVIDIGQSIDGSDPIEHKQLHRWFLYIASGQSAGGEPPPSQILAGNFPSSTSATEIRYRLSTN
ncbi:hypothetical protein PMIN02_002060 [Paraphaeosphaeria minitans]|uniref:Uncharacterized protein n=1 Tax=Paraphaeosphaeria minitans TaxID=565426 RepID=A0A9P6GA17_9PLEO|nr:hypothetical protein PMIN01_11298 [Paraphaeosphaeria minitans]